MHSKTMERYSVDERVKIVKTFYQTCESLGNYAPAVRKLRSTMAHNPPNEATIHNFIHEFELTGSIALKIKIKRPARPQTAQIEMSETFKNMKQQDWQLQSESLVDRFQKLYELAEWTDCTFRVGSEDSCAEFKCHKLVLAVNSPVFEALFYGPLAHNDSVPVLLPDIEPHVFSIFIRYLYSEKLDLKDIETAGGIFYCAKKYLMPHLAAKCMSFLESHLSLENILKILRVSEVLRETGLKKQCLKLMCRTSPRSWWNEKLIMNGALCPSTLGQLLNIMPIPDDEMGFVNTLLLWCDTILKSEEMETSMSNKRKLIDEYKLLRHIRFLRFSLSELESEIRPLKILTEEECDAIEESLRLILDPETGKAVKNPKEIPPMPDGFSKLLTPRNSWISDEEIYMRPVLSNRTKWLYGGELQCNFESDYRLLLTGFTIYTRFPSATEFCYLLRENFYQENFKVIIKGPNDKMLVTVYENCKTPYNSQVKITFEEPFWVEPKTPYLLITEISQGGGQYPSYDLAQVITKEHDRIEFHEKYTCFFNPRYSNLYRMSTSSTTGVIGGLYGRRYLPDAELSLCCED